MHAVDDLNPWWRGEESRHWQGALVERRAFPHVWEQLLRPGTPDSAVFVIGPRQVGKTTLAHQVIRKLLKDEEGGLPPQNVAYLDAEVTEFRSRGIADFVRSVRTDFDPRYRAVIVIDEVHYAKEWAEELKVLVDEGAAQFLVTGSASRRLLDGMRERLPMRYSAVRLLGLSFPEFMDLRQSMKDPFAEEGVKSLTRSEVREELREYLSRGGFPRGVTDRLAEVRNRIREYCKTVISEDVVARSGLRDDRSVNELFQYLLRNACAQISVRKLANGLGVQHTTISRWVAELEKASLIHELRASTEKRPRPASGKGKQPKIYPVDHGMIAALGHGEHRGRVMEAVVHRHLLECMDRLQKAQESEVSLMYWKGRSGEIDFILQSRDLQVLVEVNAAEDLSDGDVARFSGSAKQAGGGRAILVCMVPESRTQAGREVMSLEDFTDLCVAGSHEQVFGEAGS